MYTKAANFLPWFLFAMCFINKHYFTAQNITTTAVAMRSALNAQRACVTLNVMRALKLIARSLNYWQLLGPHSTALDLTFRLLLCFDLSCSSASSSSFWLISALRSKGDLPAVNVNKQRPRAAQRQRRRVRKNLSFRHEFDMPLIQAQRNEEWERKRESVIGSGGSMNRMTLPNGQFGNAQKRGRGCPNCKNETALFSSWTGAKANVIIRFFQLKTLLVELNKSIHNVNS